MDKYAVDTSVEGLDKQSSDAARCPVCGSLVEQNGSVLRCPQHGTEPFERRTPSSVSQR